MLPKFTETLPIVICDVIRKRHFPSGSCYPSRFCADAGVAGQNGMIYIYENVFLISY